MLVGKKRIAYERRHRDEERRAKDESAEEHSLEQAPHNAHTAIMFGAAFARLGHLQLSLLLHDRLELGVRSHRGQKLVHLLPKKTKCYFVDYMTTFKHYSRLSVI